MYNCKTCNYNVCNACTNTCHENHEVIFANYNNSSVCNCGAQQDGSCNNMVLPLNKELCTLTVPKIQSQHLFTCITCTTKFKSQLEEAGQYEIHACARCIKICHKNHSVEYGDLGNYKCLCGSEKYSPCMALAKTKENGDDSSAWNTDYMFLPKCKPKITRISSLPKKQGS